MKKLNHRLSIFIFVCTVSLGYGQQTKNEDLLDKAFQLYQDGKVATALEIAQKVISISKKQHIATNTLSDAYSLLGNCERHKGHINTAIKAHMRALDFRKDYYGQQSMEVSNSLHNLGNCYFEAGNRSTSYNFFQQALVIRLQLPNATLPVAQSLNALGLYWNEYRFIDSAKVYFQKSISILSNTKSNQSREYLGALSGLAEAYRHEKKFIKSIALLQKALFIQQIKYPDGHPYTANLLNTLANTYAQMGQLSNAIPLLRQAGELIQHFDERETMADVYLNLGNYLIDNGDYPQAIEELKFAIFKLRPGTDLPQFGHLLSSLGIALRLNQNLADALKSHQAALNYFLQTGQKQKNYIPGEYLNIANCYYDEQDWPGAIRSYQQALDGFSKNEDPVTRAKAHGNIAHCLIQLKQYQQAYASLQTAFELSQGYPRIKAQYHYSMGIIELEQKKLAQAYRQFKAAAALLNVNPVAIDPEQMNAAPHLTLQVLNGLGRCKQQNYINDKSAKNLEESTVIYQQARKLIKYLQRTYAAPESRQKLVDQFYPIYEGLIWCAYEKNDVQSIRDAWQYAEESKAIMLAEVFRAAQAKKFLNLPDSLLQQENRLHEKIAILEKQQYINVKLDVLTGSPLFLELFDLKKQLSKLQKTIEKIAPKFIQTKYPKQLTSLDKVQGIIKGKEQLVIEYFWGDKDFFVFVITDDQLKVKKIAKSADLEQSIDEFVNIIRQSPGAGIPSSQQIGTYAELAHRLYSQLLAPLQLPRHQRLIIIPDGPLGHLPFEALLTAPAKHQNNIRKFPFFLFEHATSYSFSGALLYEMSQSAKLGPQNKAAPKILAMAPTFEHNSFGFQALEFHFAELDALKKIFPRVQTIRGAQANEATFVKMAPKFKMIHLATHAQANVQRGDYAYIAFTEKKDSIENEILYARELYTIPLQSSLVVLSACETAYGQLLRGEGVISLARAFAYAGAQSLIATQWTIRDQKSPRITSALYGALAQGKSKDVALQEAKVTFIQEGTQLNAYPYFWAAFTSIGNTDALDAELRGPNYVGWLWILSILVVMALFSIFFKRWKRPTKHN